jgi:hypothetical protein
MTPILRDAPLGEWCGLELYSPRDMLDMINSEKIISYFWNCVGFVAST